MIRTPPFLLSRKLLLINLNNNIIFSMQDRKAPSLQTLPCEKHAPQDEEYELTRLYPIPEDAFNERTILQPISLSGKTLTPSSRGVRSPFRKWLVRIAILLLLSFLIMEGCLGMQLRASRMRRFGDNMEQLQREHLEEERIGGKGGFSQGKGTKMEIEGDWHVLRYYEAVGRSGQAEGGVPIMSKEDVTAIKDNGGSSKNLLSTSPLNHEQTLSQNPSFSQYPSFGFYTQGPKATAPSDPLLSPTTDPPKEQASLISQQKQPAPKEHSPTLLHHRKNKVQPYRIPSIVQQVKKAEKKPQKQTPTPIPPHPLSTTTTTAIETAPVPIPYEINITPTIFPFPFLSPPPSISTPKIHYDSFASILPSQLQTATQLRTLLNTPPLPPSQIDAIITSQRQYYQSRYKISTYPELPFCLVVPTYNNVDQKRYLRNLNSILQQEYKNFHLVIMDDHSEDNTGGMIKDLLERQNILPPQRYKLVLNEKRVYALGNIRSAALHHCSPQEIFMIVDGDDQLIGRQVLKLYNAIFQEKGVYFLYSNFMNNAGGVGYSRPFPEDVIRKNAYRKYPFVTSHLRAFYTILLRNISEKDLKDDSGEYFRAANDVAICLPILEQAHERVGYVPELTYYYAGGTGRNNHKVRLEEQRGNQRRVRGRRTYRRVEGLGLGVVKEVGKDGK